MLEYSHKILNKRTWRGRACSERKEGEAVGGIFAGFDALVVVALGRG
jgi:hypothetical protein